MPQLQPAGGVAGIAACLLIGAAFGAGVTALSMALAFSVRSHAQFFPITGFAGLPLTFASSALVPVTLMPGWLRPAAEANPLTYATDAVRSLVLDGWQPGRLAAAGLALLAFDGCCAAVAALALRRACGRAAAPQGTAGLPSRHPDPRHDP